MSGLAWIMRRLLACVRRREGGVIVWLAVTATALLLATGLAIDIARAYAVKVRLGAAVDSAALAVATTLNPNINATTRLNTFFYGNFVSNQIGTPTSISMATDAIITNAIDVTGTATVPTIFMQLAGYGTITVQATTQVLRRAPNIDFYLMLDASPSMAIAATQTDINTMVSNTQSQCDSPPAGGSSCGCAFACHETNPSAESHCNASSCNQSGTGNPGGEDNYALALSLGVTLRIDLLRQAAQNLTTTAASTAALNSAKYRMAIYTFDVNLNTIQTLTNSLATVNTSAANIQQLTVYKNNWLTSANNNNDTDTDFDNAFTSINNTMPTPGNGSNVGNDTPQEVLFVVTDGVEDETVGGSRQQSLINTANCTTIKNRGIRIAVLYTEYLPLPTNSWYTTYISSFQPNIGSTLQSCASPGLYFMVQTGGDISGALSTLFEQAVESAYLAK